jgi:hypothetical protein
MGVVSDAMTRPNRSPAVLASIAGLALVVIGCSGLDGSQPPAASAGPSGPSQEVQPAASTDAAIDPSTCTIGQAPGPADAPPKGGGDLVDTADSGPGRFRLCLTAPAAVAVEGTAWCVWSPDRSAVTEVDGLPTSVGGGPQVAGNVFIDPPRLEIEATSANGDVSTFGNAGDRRLVQVDADHRSGVAAFVVSEVVDPEHLPQVTQQPRSGYLRWVCGEPPGPRPR